MNDSIFEIAGVNESPAAAWEADFQETNDGIRDGEAIPPTRKTQQGLPEPAAAVAGEPTGESTDGNKMMNEPGQGSLERPLHETNPTPQVGPDATPALPGPVNVGVGAPEGVWRPQPITPTVPWGKGSWGWGSP